MKTPPNQTAFESAPDKRDYTPGTLPLRTDTVIAAVMASLLESNTLTGMQSVFKESTTRLGAAIYRLQEEYGWVIERRDVATGTNDGRVAKITAYWLPQATIAQAFEAGAREWIERVKADRAERRKEAGKCRVAAARRNAIKRATDPRQNSLFGGGL